jgi:hypothetical protein
LSDIPMIVINGQLFTIEDLGDIADLSITEAVVAMARGGFFGEAPKTYSEEKIYKELAFGLETIPTEDPELTPYNLYLEQFFKVRNLEQPTDEDLELLEKLKSRYLVAKKMVRTSKD